jgi:hypothetical protein
MRWERIEYADDGECCICQQSTSDLYEPVDCSDAEEALIWAMVSPAGLAGVGCCARCVERGIFNRLKRVELTPVQRDPLFDFLTTQGVAFRIFDTVRGDEEHCTSKSDREPRVCVEFNPKQEPEFLAKLATLVDQQPS